MQGDILLDPDEAQEMHNSTTDTEGLLMWTVTWNSSDYPRQAVARPHLIGRELQALREVVVADSLNELRKKLPAGLTKIDRDPEDDPVIIEVWL